MVAPAKSPRSSYLGWYEEYHPYGSTAWWASNAAITVSRKRYRYTGMERDEETGLQCHGVRYYAPWLGRWTSADPIGLRDGGNRYAYCHGEVTDSNDRSGMADGGKATSASAEAIRQHNKALIIGIRNVTMVANPDTYAMRTLEAAFRTEHVVDDGTVAGRLQAVLDATQGAPRGPATWVDTGLHFGISFGQDASPSLAGRGDSGMAPRFQDPWASSRNQVGHFLTGVRLAYDPSFLDTTKGQAFRALLGAPADEPSEVVALKLMVGHELAPDPAGLLETYDAFRAQYSAPTSEDIGNFATGRLEKIEVGSGRGNSRQDLELTYQALEFVRAVRSGEFRSNDDAADWLHAHLALNNANSGRPMPRSSSCGAPTPLLLRLALTCIAVISGGFWTWSLYIDLTGGLGADFGPPEPSLAYTARYAGMLVGVAAFVFGASARTQSSSMLGLLVGALLCALSVCS